MTLLVPLACTAAAFVIFALLVHFKLHPIHSRNTSEGVGAGRTPGDPAPSAGAGLWLEDIEWNWPSR